MGRMTWISALSVACLYGGAAAAPPDVAPGLTADQVVEKNADARGGLDAWRKIQTMAWVGHVETGSAAGSSLPFVLEMKRPNKARFAITSPHQVSMRLFDGKDGWKLRSSDGSPPDLQPYSREEAAFAGDGEVIDGPLMDYRAKGITVALEGLDEVDGRQAYRLRATFPSGASHRVWIDARDFLDVKSERTSRTPAGALMAVTKRYRDYHPVAGLLVPFLVESSGGTGKFVDRMVIDRVVLNPPIDDRAFAKPAGMRPRGMSADETIPQPPRGTPDPLFRGTRPMPPRSRNAG